MRFAIVLLLFAGAANAQSTFPRDLTLSWNNTDNYIDGTLMEAGDLDGVRIECFRQNDTVPIVTGNFPATGEGQAQSEVLTDVIPQPGTYTCQAYSIVIDSGIGQLESTASNQAQVRHVGRPNPPVTFTVQ